MKQIKIPKMEQEYEKIIEEATVDCYNEYEAFSGMTAFLGDELKFPFDAKLVGQEVKVAGVDENRSSLKAGVIMKVLFKGKKYKAALITLDIPDTSPKNTKLIETYKYWVKG